jgi:hypothetical protein
MPAIVDAADELARELRALDGNAIAYFNGALRDGLIAASEATL